MKVCLVQADLQPVQDPPGPQSCARTSAFPVGNGFVTVNRDESNAGPTDTGECTNYDFRPDADGNGEDALCFDVDCAVTGDDCRRLKGITEVIPFPAETVSFNELEQIGMRYFIEGCAAIAQPTCSKQFYINLYARTMDRLDPFYCCKFDFVAPPIAVGNSFVDFTVTLNTPFSALSSRVTTDPITSCSCPLKALTPEPTTLREAQVANAGLAMGDQLVLTTNLGLLYSLNVGDTSVNDNGIKGCFSSTNFKLKNEDATLYDFGPTPV